MNILSNCFDNKSRILLYIYQPNMRKVFIINPLCNFFNRVTQWYDKLGEVKYDKLEQRLAASPVISVPTITLEGDANGAPHPDAASYAGKFSNKYAHRVITGGVGHNLPQEAPQAFAEAVIKVAEG